MSSLRYPRPSNDSIYGNTPRALEYNQHRFVLFLNEKSVEREEECPLSFEDVYILCEPLEFSSAPYVDRVACAARRNSLQVLLHICANFSPPTPYQREAQI